MSEKGFLSGFSVFFSPDKVFAQTVKERDIFKTYLRVFFSSLFFFTVTLHLFRVVELHAIKIPLPDYLATVLIGYVLAIIICAVTAFSLDLLYVNTIKIQGRKMKSDFISGFLCRLFLMPLWVMVIAVAIFPRLSKAGLLWLVFIAVLIIRLLDMEARLLKAVYKLTLKQGYVVVILQDGLLILGIILAYFILKIPVIF